MHVLTIVDKAKEKIRKICFQQFQTHLLCIKNKDSNLISDLRDKYGENSVSLIRKWENTTKKMADYRNHRRFTPKCIKASVTPVSL